MSQDITALDLFCGAGGSSSGLVNAGVRVRTAVNHWKLAIETHSTNHPNTDHDLTDVRLTHPSRYQKTDIFWASPECVSHSLAKGRRRKNIEQLDLWGNTQVDPSEERSRATMREVVEFAEYHRHEIIIVENVVDIRYWAHYDAWLTDMINLGYEHKALYLNAQFFEVPQSRDRIYIVFWKRGNKAPDLEFRPPAICEKHGQIEAVQSWKKPEYQWGRYGSRRQYVYRCPHCAAEVMPFYVPAMYAIDWRLPSQPIGEREKPLKPKTIERIIAGLKKFAGAATLVKLGYAGGDRATSPDAPLPTQTTRQTLALLQPFLLQYYTRDDASSSVDDAMPVIPTEPRHALITPPFTLNYMNNETEADGVDRPLRTVATRNTPSLVTPPFVASYFGNAWTYAHAGEPMPTQTTIQRHALIVPEGELPTPEEMLPHCGFRMLEPQELQRGMSFPDSYIILGNKREQVKQIGNAVCCNVAEWIVRRCVESLT